MPNGDPSGKPGEETGPGSLFAHPRRYRWRLSLGLCIALCVIGALFLLLVFAIDHSSTTNPATKSPGSIRALYGVSGGILALGLVCLAYVSGFSITFAQDGVRRRGFWPTRNQDLLWSDLVRVDFFVQQRKLGLGGRPATTGVETEKIAGFRFWGKGKEPLVCDSDFFSYADSKGVASLVFDRIVAPAVRSAAASGLEPQVRILQGSAAQEKGFKGRLQKELRVADLTAKGEALRVTLPDGKKEWISSPEADHQIFEIRWGPATSSPPKPGP